MFTPYKYIGTSKSQNTLFLLLISYLVHYEYKKYKKNNIKEEYEKIDKIKK
jgi:hypothetical protein